MTKKIILFSIACFFILCGFVSYFLYSRIFSNNIKKTGELYIETKDSLLDLTNKIAPFLENKNSFYWVATQKKYSDPKAGRYLLEKGMSNNDLINLLRSGNQTPVKVSFNNQDTLEKLADRISEQIESDPKQLLDAFKDLAFLKKNNLNEKSVLGIFIPNTYELYWNTSAEGFRNKMLVEFNQFWNKSRLLKAKKINLTKNEVITLASIVQKETVKKSERPIVAGLYLNRLKKEWPLQADPTIIYSIKQKKGQNYVVKRVLLVDLEIDSPYNTYQRKGLPPSLISMPDITSIDAVLNAEKHNYYYMCANIEKLGFHSFAKTLSQHNRNANKYHRWLNKQGINR